jgi:hypothetical protein
VVDGKPVFTFSSVIMGIFKEMYDGRQFTAAHEYRQLRRMLSEAIERGFVEQIPVVRGSFRQGDGAEWYREKETGEIYALYPPWERGFGAWQKIDLDDLIGPQANAQ